MSFTDKDKTIETPLEDEDLDESVVDIIEADVEEEEDEEMHEEEDELSSELDVSSEMEIEPEISIIEGEDEGDDEEIMQPVQIEAPIIEKKVIEVKKSNAVPPLRPLSIAPKPAKVPFSLKSVGGQQLVLVQGGGSSGQQIKLLSPHGQNISLANLSLSGKAVTLKSTNANTSTVSSHKSGHITFLQQPKQQLVMKKMVQHVPKSALMMSGGHKTTYGQQIVVVQKNDQQLKLIQSGSAGNTKTLTLAQAQQMGIITSGTKLVPQQGGTKQIILNKNQSKTIKIVPQMRSPTKILPAPNTMGKMAQRIILKPSGGASGAGGALMNSQFIQVSGANAQGINAGQLHQINIPGKGMQYIKFITSQNADATTSTVGTLQTIQSTQNINKNVVITSGSGSGGFKSRGGMLLSELKTLSGGKQATTLTKTIKAGGSSLRQVNISVVGGANEQQLVHVLPAGYVPRVATSAAKVAIPAIRHATPTTPSNTTAQSNTKLNNKSQSADALVPTQQASAIISGGDVVSLESNGMRPRKPCNCTKSQCLKLYCDCFANGEFCYMCNCMNCFNNLENEEHRQRAIKNCLERNPNAFRPKIGKAKDPNDAAIRKHTKGCNCKRSGCLKNYCECYEAKIACSSNCKCMGCRNIEDSMDKRSRSSMLSESSFSISPQHSNTSNNRHHSSNTDKTVDKNKKGATINKQAFNYITNEVIEATSQCLLTLSDNAEETEQDEEVTKKQIIVEFSRCLKEIIECTLVKYNK